jgi:hypothetical protein
LCLQAYISAAHALSPSPFKLLARRNLMTTLPLDLLVALSPFIVLGILSLIGK